jgi:hypothetical protein
MGEYRVKNIDRVSWKNGFSFILFDHHPTPKRKSIIILFLPPLFSRSLSTKANPAWK